MADVLTLAGKHYAFGQELHAEVAKRLLRLWKGVERANIVRSWSEVVLEAVAVVTAAQLAAAEDSAEYMAAALATQGLDTSGPAPRPEGFAGVAYPLQETARAFDLTETLMAPAYTSLIGIRFGHPVDRALGLGLNDLLLRSQMQVADAARNADGVLMATRTQPAGWVRMLNPPSCSRCALLAGKWYRANEGFRRHPGCDCRHIPAAENTAGALTTDPYEYFHSLDPAERRRLFTNAGAQAIEDGADIFQVVNARKGMYTSTGGSLVTREGTTRRGTWGSAQQTRDRKGTERYGVSIRQRMMPEEIYKRANTREQALRLLEDYGYIIPAGQVPTGAIQGAGAGFLGGRKISY